MKQRITWLDFARGITIFFVVFGHSLSTIYDTDSKSPLFFIPLMSIIFTFIMPCFFAISGYLYKPINNINDYKSMIFKKIINLGIPYLFFSIIYVVMQNFGGNNVNHHFSYNSLLNIYSTPIAYLWFLYALFFIFIIVGLIDLFNINIYIQLLIYVIFTIFSIIFSNYLWLGLQATLNNILFFYIGYIISKNIHNYRLNRIIKSKKSTIILTILFIVLLIIQSFYSVGESVDTISFSNVFTKIISIVLMINVSIIIPKNKFYNYFVNFGKLTLIIYLVHAPAMSVLRVVSFKLININNVSVVLLSIIFVPIIWYFCVFVCYLSKNINIINFIFYPLYNYKRKK